MKMKKPCSELKIQNRYCINVVNSPTAKKPKTQVSPSRIEHEKVILVSLKLKRLSAFFSSVITEDLILLGVPWMPLNTSTSRIVFNTNMRQMGATRDM